MKMSEGFIACVIGIIFGTISGAIIGYGINRDTNYFIGGWILLAFIFGVTFCFILAELYSIEDKMEKKI